MEIIIPLRVETITAKFRRAYYSRIVQRALSDDIHAPVERRSLLMHGFSQLFQKVQCRVIEYGVYGIQPERVKVILRDPFESIRNKKMPDFVAVGIVEIQRRAPRCFVTTRKIGRELGKIISFRPDMVIDDV